MKQVLQNLRSGETMVIEVPAPTPQAGEVLVRTAASLLSAGTERMVVEFAGKSLVGKARSRPDQVRQVMDKARREGLLATFEAVMNRLDQPMALGYSSAGTVIALGEGVQGMRVGQRVACAGGGYAIHAEMAAIPTNLISPLPENVDFDAAAFGTLGAIALHGFRLAEVQLGEGVAVIGLGLLGLLTAGIAAAAGCQVLGIDLDPRRVALAQQMGAQGVLRQQAVEAALGFSRGRGCDAVLICADTASTDPVELAGAIARDRARVIAIGAVGLSLPRKVYYEKELTFLNSRSYGPGRYDPVYEEGGVNYPIGYVRWTEGRNLEAVIDLMSSSRLDVHPLISHRFTIEQAPEAYELITGQSQEPFLGVLLTYPQAQPETRHPAELSTLPSPPLHPQATTRPERVALGVLGAGNFATAVMLPALKGIPELELVGIASASGASAQHAAGRYGFRYATGDESQILADPQINTIAILTRHHLHARQALAGLSSGKHVFCEKPLALDEAELDEIQQTLESSSRSGAASMLMVGFNRRFSPLARHLADFLAGRTEPLVAHYRVNAGYLPLNHWTQDLSQGGGRVIGEACHFIDFLAFLCGQPPITVTAHGLPDGGRYREDNVVLTFTFPDGSLGTVSYLANGDKAFPKERVEVFCAGRVAILDDYRALETISNGRRNTYRARLRQDKGHRHEWQAFVQAILSGGPPPIPYEHIFSVTRASFTALQSLRSRQTLLVGGPP